jgi:hypothetical protein
MNYALLLPGLSITQAEPKGDLVFAVNSAALYHPCDFLCFRDGIVKERLIDSGKVNPQLGYVTDVPSFDEKIHICPQFDLSQLSCEDDPLRTLVLQQNYFTSHLALAMISQMMMSGDRLDIWGMDFTLEPTATKGEWVSQHSLHGFVKEAIWLRLLMMNIIHGGKELSVVLHSEENFFHHYMWGRIDGGEFMKEVKIRL